MADTFELTLALDLRDELLEGGIAELRWHLGPGPQPEVLGIVTEFPAVVEDEHGEPAVEDHPEPLPGQNGEASDVGGVLASVLLRGQDTRSDAWAHTSRREIHPDRCEETGALLGSRPAPATLIGRSTARSTWGGSVSMNPARSSRWWWVTGRWSGRRGGRPRTEGPCARGGVRW